MTRSVRNAHTLARRLHTPGHTPGGTSWTWKSCEGAVCYDMVYADSLNPISAQGFRFTKSREYPQALEDFEKSFAFFEATPCDVLITAHPEVTGLWDRLAQREKGVKPDPLVDSGCRKLAEDGREKLRQTAVAVKLLARLFGPHQLAQ